METGWSRFLRHTREHLELVRLSFVLAVLVGVPLGVFAAKRARLGQVVLGVVGIVQTIPALALLVMLIKPAAALGLPSVGTGSAAAVAAGFGVLGLLSMGSILLLAIGYLLGRG